MSPATADRILQPYRKQERHGISTTRSGTLLKKQIPIRTFNDWKESAPGFMEADLVAHCGPQAEGSYLFTLTLTDIATGWTECLPLLGRGQEVVIAALKRARQLLPFPLLGIDTDNGGEFINMELAAYCEQEQITFTRGRPRKSNDQCYVEQKNGQIVRQVVGYDRFDFRACSTFNSRNGTERCGSMSIAFSPGCYSRRKSEMAVKYGGPTSKLKHRCSGCWPLVPYR